MVISTMLMRYARVNPGNAGYLHHNSASISIASMNGFVRRLMPSSMGRA